MRFLLLLIFNPFAALVGVAFAALALYGSYDFVERHWMALLLAIAASAATYYLLNALPNPRFMCPGSIATFTTTFLITLAGYILASGAVPQHWNTGHWNAHAGLAIAAASGILFTLFRRRAAKPAT
ncbi:MAG TPA: hypothetical protein P5256_00050 [Beijerinckiaceae bacterium]|nr:hypothetical protein [Rhodoblastus sp.]MCB1533360.1 hypothetical protein [Rhodoblastus sp.]MCC2106080.1 hypothetical protein [Hyphomicrobiales bacterium]HRY01486.1 hypothetical protein [Beijerinckiaceae bacterium]